ncbi:MAG TPA: glycosyltransferase family 4 protein, partial [Candidatus Synoicihabitans sp.]|nr:glycosyltransferase family 4 protein [Candidatus Synoicihabitans sp.]
GVKIKLVEAAAHGCAVVTTPIGLQGLGFLTPATTMAADPHDFAVATSALLKDAAARRQKMDTIHTLVSRHLSPERCYWPAFQALLLESVDDFGNSPAPAADSLLSSP